MSPWVDGQPQAPALRPEWHRAKDAPDSRPENELKINFEALASSEAAGCATPEELATLRAAP
ncbi:MAG: hypothetical protein ACRD0O_02775, partial [Acidimicrobiia bacterium]